MTIAFRTIFIIFAVASFCGSAQSQFTVDNKTSLIDGPDKDERPKNIKEKLFEMQIEKEKKEHEEMLARGKEAVKLSIELQNSFIARGSFSSEDLDKLGRVEKLVKKIRSDLGGNDDDDQNAEKLKAENGKGLVADAIDSLKSRSSALLEELKKTSRFTISAAAIATSNVLLRITKLLRFRQ